MKTQFDNVTPEEVKSFLAATGKTQAYIAKAFGKTPAAVQNWLKKGCPGYYRGIFAGYLKGYRYIDGKEFMELPIDHPMKDFKPT